MTRQLPALACIALLLGCGEPAPSPENSSSAAEVQSAPPPAADAAGPSRDLASLDLCALVPGDLVRTTLGIEFNRDPISSPKDYMSECTYFEQHGGTYVAWVSAASDFDVSRQFEELEMTPVPGLADDAYITYSETEEQHSVCALVRGDATIGAYGRQKDRAIALAKLVAERL